MRKPNEDKTKGVAKTNKKELSKTPGIITEHPGSQAHRKKISAEDNNVCRACGMDDETLEHFLCQCPAFASN